MARAPGPRNLGDPGTPPSFNGYEFASIIVFLVVFIALLDADLGSRSDAD